MQGLPPWNRRVRAEALRGYPLEDAARALGYRRDPDDAARWRRPGSVLSINRFMFYDHLCGDGGGGAIDLVAHARRCTRPEAVDFLDRLPSPVPPGHRPRPRREPRWPDLRSRLVERHGLSDLLVELCRDLDLIRTDPRGDAVFVRRNAAGRAVGAEILTAATPRRPEPPANAARGGFWMSWDPDWPTAVILAASALDALSILALISCPPGKRDASSSPAEPSPPSPNGSGNGTQAASSAPTTPPPEATAPPIGSSGATTGPSACDRPSTERAGTKCSSGTATANPSKPTTENSTESRQPNLVDHLSALPGDR